MAEEVTKQEEVKAEAPVADAVEEKKKFQLSSRALLKKSTN